MIETEYIATSIGVPTIGDDPTLPRSVCSCHARISGVDNRLSRLLMGTVWVSFLFFVGPSLTRLAAQPVWQSSTTAVGASNSASTNKPDQVVAGDLLVAGVMFESGTGTSINSIPSGWNLILRQDQSSNVGMAVYYKIATASEPTSYSWGFGSSPKWAIGISRITGANTNSPIAISGQGNGSSGNPVAPSITTTSSNNLILAFFTNKKGTTYTGVTQERYDVPNTSGGIPSNMLATFVQSTAGATGTRTATAGETAEWVAMQIAVVPPPPIFRSIATGSWSSNTTWEQSGNGGIDWVNATSTPGALNNVTIRSGHTVTLSSASSAAQTTVNGGGTLALSSFGLTAGSISIETGTSSAATISGTGTLTLGGNISATNASSGSIGATISCPIALGANRSFTIANGSAVDDLTISGIVGGAFNLTKEGEGNLLLSGANTYSGTTTINAGILKLGASSTVNTSSPTGAAGVITVSSGGTLDMNGFSYTSGHTQAISINGTGASGIGAITNSSSTASTLIGPITFSTAASITGEGGLLNITGTPVSAATAITLGGTVGGSISTVIGGDRTLTKQGSGTWTLSGANTYSGTTTINAGILKLGASSTVNTSSPTGAAGVITVSSGGTLDMNGFSYTSGHTQAISINGTGASGIGAITNSSSTASTLIGPITFSTAASITGEGGLLNITGTPVSAGTAITLGGAVGGSISTVIGGTSRNLIKSGSGTWTLSGANTYTGTTTITEGILSASTIVVASSASNLGNASSPIVLGGASTSGTLVYTGNTASYTRGFTVNAGGGGITNATSNELTIGSTGITNGGSLTFSNTSTGGTTVSSVISSTGSIVINNSGSGATTLSGANTYSGGTTLSAGTFNINNAGSAGTSSAIGTGSFTVNGGILNNTLGSAIILSTNNALILNNSFTFTGSQSLHFGTGSVTLPSNTSGTITVNGNSLTIGGTLNQSTFNLTKAGAGTLSLGSQSATLSGLTISAGTFISTSGNLSISGNFSNSGTFNSNSGTLTFNGSGAQSVQMGSSSLHNLTISNSSGVCTVLTNNLTVNSTLTTNAGATLDMGANVLSATTIAHSGSLKTASISATPIPSGKTWGGTVEFSANGGQTLQQNTFNNLTLSHTSGTQTAAGNITINGTLNTAAGGTLDLSTYTLDGTLTGLSHSGTLKTASTSATPIPSGNTWGGTVEFTANGGQTLQQNTFNNLILSNTSGTNTAVANITVNGTLTTTAGGTFDMGSYTLNGSLSGLSHSGTLKTASSSATPFPSGKTWGGTVQFYANATQTVPSGTFQNLTITDTNAGTNYQKTAASNVVVNGTLNLDCGNASASLGALDIPSGYLDLGVNATITGTGNLTGTVRRRHLFTQTGSLLPFTGANQGLLLFDLPDQTGNPLTLYIKATTGAPIPTSGCTMTNTPNPVKRYYTIWREGSNWGNAKSSFRHYYLPAELPLDMNNDTINESLLSVWKKTSDGSSCTIEELGKSNQDTDANFVGIARQPITSFISGTEGYTQIFAAPTAVSTLEWNGSVSVTMTTAENWTPQGVPSANVALVIPHDVTFTYNPVLPNNATLTAKSMLVESGKTLTAGNNSILKLVGQNQVFLVESNATFTQGNSTILVESGSQSTIAGTTTLYNLTVASGTELLVPIGAQLTVGGTLTNNGTITTAPSNTIIFSGTNQVIPNTSSGVSAFYNLTISGTGTTLPVNLNLNGNLSYTGSGINSSGTTLSMNGALTQSIGGNSISFSGLTVNNTDPTSPSVILNTPVTVEGALTFTNGLVNSSNHLLILGVSASITGAGPGKYVSGNLRRYVPNTSNPSLSWAIGYDNTYSPVTLAFSGAVSGSGYIDINSAVAVPPVASGLSQTKYINRKWVIANNGVSFPSSDPTFSFAASNIQGSADPQSLVVRKLSGSSWTALTTGTRTSSSTQATGVTEFSEFYIGEPAALEVSQQPSSQNVCEATTNIQFSAQSSSLPAPSVQWQRDAGSGFVNIDGTTDGAIYTNFQTTSLNISTASLSMNSYQYRAVFTNINGSVNSNGAVLTVSPTTVGGTASGGTAVCLDSNSTVLNLSGQTGSVVRWESSTNAGSSWTTISNTNTAYTAENISVNTRYRAVVKSGTCAEVNSAYTEITVDAVSQGGTLSGSATVCTGINSTVLTLSGIVGNIQDWEASTNGGSSWTSLNHTTSTYTATNLTTTTQYRAIVKNGVCTQAYSSVATVTVSALSVAGTATAADSEVCGGVATTITLSGSTGTIQWEESVNNSNWTNVTGGSGQTTTVLTTPPITSALYFRASVTNGACQTVYATSVYITVASGSVGIITGAGTVCSGTNNTTLTLSGQTGDIIKWQYLENGQSVWQDISNTTATQTVVNITVTTQYRADVNVSGCGEIFTTPVTILVDALPIAGNASATNGTLCSGDSDIISLTGSTGTIQWQESSDNTNWSNVSSGSGGGTNAYTTPSLSSSIYYRAVVTNGVCAAVFSNSVNITVNERPTAPNAGSVNTAYTGMIQAATATPPSGSSLLWYSASTGGSLTAAPSATNAGTYTAWAASQGNSSGCESATRTEVTLTISQVQLTVTAVNQNKVYDGLVFSPFTSTITGFVNNENQSVITGSITYSGTATAATQTGTYTIVPILSSLSATNYSFSAVNGTLTITSKQLTISGLTAQNKVYDGTTTATVSGTPQLVGTVDGDDVSLSGTPTYQFADENVANNILVTTGGFSLSGTDAGNYSLTLPSFTANITPRSITIQNINAKNKVYDGTTTTYLNFSNYAFNGLISGDVVFLDTSSYTANFNNKNVANGKPITVTGLALAVGTDASNYTLEQPGSLTADIENRIVIPTVTVANKAYNGTTAATITGYSVANLIGGETVNASGGTAVFDTKEVGTGKLVTITGLSLTGVDASNYQLSSTTTTTTASISACSLTITADAVNKTFGEALTGGAGYTSFATSGLQNGETVGSVTVSYGNGAAVSDNVGTYADQVVISTATGGTFNINNYTVTYETGDIVISQRSLTITALAQSKTYGATAPVAGILNTHFSVSGLQGSDAVSGVTLSYGGSPAGNLATAAVGSYTITPSALTLSSGSTGNYSITYTNGTLTVNAAALTVAAVAKTKAYGNTLSTTGALTTDFTVSGLQNSDAASSVTLSFSGSPAGNLANAAVGSYTITPSALVLSSGSTSNYAITYNTASLTVVAGAPVKLVIANIATQTAGTAFSVTVEAQDSGNNPANVSSNSSISLSLLTGTGTLSGTLTGTITSGTSSVTISGVTYTKAENISLQASQTSGTPSLTAGSSNTFTVAAAPFTTFRVESSAGGNIPNENVNQAFTIKITATDNFGNTITSFTGTVNITSTGTLSAGGGTTAAFSSGVLASHSVTFSNTGTFTITATRASGGTQAGISNAFSVGRNLYARQNGDWSATTTWSNESETGGTCSCTPTAADNVYIGFSGNERIITIATGYSATAANLFFGYNGSSAVINQYSLTFSAATSQLTVSEDVYIYSGTEDGKNRTLAVGAGTLTVGGTLAITRSSNSNNNSLARLTLSTGTVNTNNLSINAAAAGQAGIVFSGAGTMNIDGAFTITNSLGTLTPNAGTVNFRGTTAQTIPIGVSSVLYNNVDVNNTSIAGATFSAATTTANLAGNIRVGNINSGSLLNTNGVAMTLAASKSVTVAAGSTVDAGASVITLGTTPPNPAVNIQGIFKTSNTLGFTGSTDGAINTTNSPVTQLGSNSTVEYSAASTQTLTLRTDYANLTLSGGSKTVGSGTLTASKNVTINSGATFNGSGNPTINFGGDFTNNGTFTQGTGTLTFNGTTQTLSGTSSTSFTNLVVASNTSLELESSASVANTLTMSPPLVSGTGTLNLNCGATINPGSSGVTLSCPLNVGSSNRTITVNDNGSASNDLIVSSVVSGSGGITKSGTGALLLSGTNTYSGGTVLSVGRLNLGSAGAIGSGSLTISGAATLDNTSGAAITLSNNPALALNGNLTFEGSNALNVGNGTITMDASRTITTNGSILTLGGSLSASSYSLTKAGNGTLAFGSNTITLNSITISAGSFTSTSGTLSLAGSLTNNGTFNNNSGTVDFNGTGAQSVPALNYHNLTLSAARSTNSITLANSGTIGIAGTFNPAATFTSGTYVNTGSTINFNGSGSQEIPAFNYNNLTSSSSGARTLASSGTIGVAGIFTPGSNSFTTTGSTLDFNGTGAQSIPAITYHNLTFSTGNTKSLAGSTTLTGNLTNNNGVTFSAGSNNLTLAGNWTNNGTFSAGTSLVTFNGSGTNQTITGTNTFNNLTINQSSTGHVTAVGSTLSVSSLLKVQSGTFKSSTQYNDVQIDNGATLECAANGSIEVSGDWTNDGAFTANNGTVTFNGSAAQTVGGANATTFYNLTANNTSGGITVDNDVIIEGTLTLTSGIISSTSNEQVISVKSNGDISGGSASSFVSAKLARELTNTSKAAFPVGKGSSYRPVEFTYASNPGTKTVTIEHFSSGSPLNISTASTGGFGASYWNITQSATGTGYTVGLHNNGASPTGSVVLLRREGTGATSQTSASFSTPYYSNATTFSTGNTSNDVGLAETAIPLTVDGATTSNKVYDGTTIATVTGGSLVGVLSGDAITLTQTGTFVTKDVGSNIAITANFSLSGTNAGAYTLTQPSLTARDITTKSLTISTPTIASKTYDAISTSGSITPGTLTGLVGTETLNVTATGVYPDANVGAGKTATVSYTLSDGSNGGLATNYTLSGGSGTGDITAKGLTVTATAQSKTYGASAPTAGLLNTHFTVGGLQGSDAASGVTLAYSGSPAGNLATAAVGSYIITPSLLTLSSGSTSNYTISYITGTLTVDPAALTLTANAFLKCFGVGHTFAGTEFTTSGLLNADVVTSVTLSSAGTVSGAAAGTYPIVPSSAVFSSGSASNYTITYQNGTLTVNPQIMVTSTQIDDPCQTGAAEISVQISGGSSPYTVSACGTYTALHPNSGQGVTITNPNRVGVNASTTYSGLPGNATYRFIITDTNNCQPN